MSERKWAELWGDDKMFLTLFSHVERKLADGNEMKNVKKKPVQTWAQSYMLQLLSFHLSSGWRFASHTLRTRWHTNRLRSETVSQFMLVSFIRRILFLIINSHRWQYYFVSCWNENIFYIFSSLRNKNVSIFIIRSQKIVNAPHFQRRRERIKNLFDKIESFLSKASNSMLRCIV